MPVVTLSDGSQHEFTAAVSIMEVAQYIGPSLAKTALAARINNGKLVDTSTQITTDADLTIITSLDAEALEVIRHSTAHLLAMATQDLFPDSQVAIGPVIEDGFYYDFSYKRAFNLDDLQKIENRMVELANQDFNIERVVMSRNAAIRLFKDMGEEYKVKIINDLPDREKIFAYRQGKWIDLCRGPHVPSTGKLQAFKLMRVAGAYWRGDSSNEMLTRIYGTAWNNKKELKAYLQRLAAAEKRDHRKLGKKLDLFHMQAGAPGMVFWHPNGWAIYHELEQYMRKQQIKYGYQEIKTPQLVDRSLWEKSGHWDKYNDNMFTTHSKSNDIAIKPMNCPCHVQVFNQTLKSYRDLPLRLAEFGSCHRNEASGALYGIMRVRGFTQDDAHIFATEIQIQEEVIAFIDMLHEAYADFGFKAKQLSYKLSTRPDKRVGSNEMWDKAEKALVEALNTKKLLWKKLPGEGAFYGPKVEFSLKDCIGRIWQCGTVQVDFSMPARLGAKYIDENGHQKTPVMLHRALLGSFERFIGILIEHYEGAMPTWLSPNQIAILNITDRQSEYVDELKKIFMKKGFRVNTDLRNEKIGFKIRKHTLNKVPYLLIIGDKEMKNRTVAVRTRTGEDLGAMSIKAFVARLRMDIIKCGRTA